MELTQKDLKTIENNVETEIGLPKRNLDILQKLLLQVRCLATQHSSDYVRILEDSQSNSVSISFSVKIKGKKMKTKISYAAEKNKDEREDYLDDPRQEKLNLN